MLLQWVGWIKDYDGGTLMECVINPRLPYTGFPGLVEQQREALDRHIRTLSKSHVVHPGIASFGAGRIDVGSIPGESISVQYTWVLAPQHFPARTMVSFMRSGRFTRGMHGYRPLCISVEGHNVGLGEKGWGLLW